MNNSFKYQSGRFMYAGILFLLLWGLPLTARAQFNYTITNGAVMITGYAGAGGAVAIPDTIEDLPVTIVGTRAFQYCSNLTAVSFGSNVCGIGDYAFYFCTSLTTAPLPNNLTNLGMGAFCYCSSLAEAVLPPRITTIAVSAFLGCTSLPSVSIPDTVTSIQDYAFEGCTGLTNLWIPKGVTWLGNKAFYDCGSLMAVGVDQSNAFFRSVDGVLFNKNLWRILKYPDAKGKSYTIPNSASEIGSYAFAHCTGLTNIIIPNTVTNIRDYGLEYCTGLSRIVIPYGVTYLGYAAFANCEGLASVEIPESVATISRWVFGNCISLPSVRIPKSVTSIGTEAFSNSRNLARIDVDPLNPAFTSVDGVLFDKNLTRILKYPEGKPGTSFRIPDTVTNIADWAFYYCTALRHVTVPSGVVSLGDGIFYLCTSLSGLYFEGNAPTVGIHTFAPFYPGVYYLPGATGWGPTFGGAPTALWPPPTITTPPQTQTAEESSTVEFLVAVSDWLPRFCLWYCNDTNLISCSSNSRLQLTNVQFGQAGTYTVIVTNAAGSVTSAPAMLNIIARVERRQVPALDLTGQTGSTLQVEYVDSLSLAPNWNALDSATLAGSSQHFFDVSLPFSSQRFYRVWESGSSGVVPSLSVIGLIPAITLTGNAGDTVHVDYINQFGPIDAWVQLDTVALTNTSQLYFDLSAIRQPPRLWRIVPVQ